MVYNIYQFKKSELINIILKQPIASPQHIKQQNNCPSFTCSLVY